MSHQETDNQVDYVSDSSKKEAEEKEGPIINCKNCFHKDLCYWYTQLFVLQEGMKQAKPPVKVELPFDASILATKCNQFITKRGVGAPEPEKTVDTTDLEEETETTTD